MRDRDELKAYRRDIGHTDDSDLCDMLDRLIAGDETLRDEVESTLDEIDSDCERYDA